MQNAVRPCTLRSASHFLSNRNLNIRDHRACKTAGQASIVVNIEQTFGVQFTGNQLAEFKNVGELKKLLVATSNS
jgi:hypothetical protein